VYEQGERDKEWERDGDMHGERFQTRREGMVHTVSPCNEKDCYIGNSHLLSQKSVCGV